MRHHPPLHRPMRASLPAPLLAALNRLQVEGAGAARPLIGCWRPRHRPRGAVSSCWGAVSARSCREPGQRRRRASGWHWSSGRSPTRAPARWLWPRLAALSSPVSTLDSVPPTWLRPSASPEAAPRRCWLRSFSSSAPRRRRMARPRPRRLAGRRPWSGATLTRGRPQPPTFGRLAAARGDAAGAERMFQRAMEVPEGPHVQVVADGLVTLASQAAAEERWADVEARLRQGDAAPRSRSRRARRGRNPS